jgi:tRNA pseudouridine38-40 synthase
MHRFKLTLEYDGTSYCGWQRQDDARSIQGEIERAATALDQAPVIVQGAGRTDAGVHALGQVAHLDLKKDLTGDKVRDALNYHLKRNSISVLSAEAVDDTFHARFDATKRYYLYRIIDRRPPLALDKGQAWRVSRKLDVEAMHLAAQALVGKHDFSTFRDGKCQAKSPVKTMDAISVARYGEEVQITCHARSFLHRQVRSFVGSLVEVGLGKWTIPDFKNALQAATRDQCGPVAPSDGLYLTEVYYPPGAGKKA